MVLHEDRFFDPDPAVRRVARELYEETRRLPIVSPHGHVDPRILATNEPFAEPAALIVQPDHYILRMLYSRGIPLERLLQGEPRAVWRLFAEQYFLFRGTPTGAWLDHELHEVLGVSAPLSAETAERSYDEIMERLAGPDFRPRALFERFDIEVLATTDAASDPLRHHCAIKESRWKGRVIPCFRPDAVFKIAAPGWAQELEKLGREHGAPLVTTPSSCAPSRTGVRFSSRWVPRRRTTPSWSRTRPGSRPTKPTPCSSWHARARPARRTSAGSRPTF